MESVKTGKKKQIKLAKTQRWLTQRQMKRLILNK